jgi:hypothetical protein
VRRCGRRNTGHADTDRSLAGDGADHIVAPLVPQSSEEARCPSACANSSARSRSSPWW